MGIFTELLRFLAALAGFATSLVILATALGDSRTKKKKRRK